MKTSSEQLEQIHESLVNGQRKQMVEQINEYGLYSFFADYKTYLQTIYTKEQQLPYIYFADATISYFRITNR
jgi:hypothetical protein